MPDQDTAPPFEKAPGAHRDHRSMLVKVWEVIDGDYACYCGEPAVVEMRTQPDADPGLMCALHGLQWFDLIARSAFSRSLRESLDEG